MYKEIGLVSQGKQADIGEYRINRILPTNNVRMVGPFVFLDHLLPLKHAAGEPRKTVEEDGEHPHRGIATLTYILHGEAEHFDSNGHHAIVRSGGAQWMKAGNGITHAEAVNVDPDTNDLLTQALQFWINLPAREKAAPPDYVPVQAEEVPVQLLGSGAGYLRVIAGEYGYLVSKIPGYTKQFLYHIHLNPGKSFSLPTTQDLEYALFLPMNNAVVNDERFDKGDFLVFTRLPGTITISSPGKFASDIILFGGEPYTEPVVSHGPFVMNSQEEIDKAYADYRAGKYGRINFSFSSFK